MAKSPENQEEEEARLLARERAGDNAAPLSVSEISALLKRTVEDRFGHVRLRGELSGVKRAASGHFYCALKDDKAVIDGVMWRGNADRLAFRPEDGIEVIASGKLTTYPGRSKYQIVIDAMEIAGEGALLALLAKLKAKLEAEGLFAPERKRRLPYLPQVIGVVTSPTGAVIRDILHRLSDRFPSHVLVWPVLVQGQGAAEQVAAAVRGFSGIAPGGAVPRPDLVIVARGGGSIEDLWSFNEEIVVRAVAESTIPVISAVGHETDTTLCDFAADLRAPTPTAAAELAVPVRQELRAQLDEYSARARRGVICPVSLARERLTAWSERLPDPRALADAQGQRLDELTDRLRRGLAGRAERARAALAQSGGGLRPALLLRNFESHRRDLARVPDSHALIRQRHRDATQALGALSRVLPQLNPEAPLERGYAIVSDAAGHPVTSRAAAETQPALTLKFRDGTLDVAPAASPPSARARRRKPGKSPRAKDDSDQQSLF